MTFFCVRCSSRRAEGYLPCSVCRSGATHTAILARASGQSSVSFTDVHFGNADPVVDVQDDSVITVNSIEYRHTPDA